jgi:hypothetical protein
MKALSNKELSSAITEAFNRVVSGEKKKRPLVKKCDFCGTWTRKSAEECTRCGGYFS